MTMRIPKAIFLILIFSLLAACSPTETADPTETLSSTLPPDEPTVVIAEEVTPTMCPRATPEWLRVHPVTSPTSELTQTIYVNINNGESVSITTPAGTFEGRAEEGQLEESNFRYNFVVDIDLLPDSEQELTVQTQIRQLEKAGCPYGGYPLTTKVDTNFEPLVIIQEP